MNLGLYMPVQEENIYVCRQVKIWEQSGLITLQQFSGISCYLESELRQTTLFFRVLFFVFTILLVAAMAGLIVWMMRKADAAFIAGVILCYGAAVYAVAEYLVRQYGFYRHGVEEALTVAALFLVCAGFGWLLNDTQFSARQSMRLVTLLAASGACWIFFRFGYAYTAAIGIVALCVLCFQFSLSFVAERLILLGILAVVFLCTLAAGRSTYDFRKNVNTMLQACLLVAFYLTVNLHVFGLIGLLSPGIRSGHIHPEWFPFWMYCSSYILTFVLSAAGIYWGILSRRRLILNVGLLLLLATLATNKSYLGWTRNAWDPAILGAVMITFSLLLNRWLSSGPQKSRYGFTAEDILKTENPGIRLADAAAAFMPGVIDANQPPQDSPSESCLQGGRSGGGGAERTF